MRRHNDILHQAPSRINPSQHPSKIQSKAQESCHDSFANDRTSGFFVFQHTNCRQGLFEMAPKKSKLNPGETPIFGSPLVASVASLFSKPYNRGQICATSTNLRHRKPNTCWGSLWLEPPQNTEFPQEVWLEKNRSGLQVFYVFWFAEKNLRTWHHTTHTLPPIIMLQWENGMPPVFFVPFIYNNFPHFIMGESFEFSLQVSLVVCFFFRAKIVFFFKRPGTLTAKNTGLH